MPEFVPNLLIKGKIDAFTRGYLIAAEFTSQEEIGGADEWDDSAIAKASEDCERFQNENWEDLMVYCEHISTHGYSDSECAGMDFWYSRNRHGTGFWDRTELPEGLGDKLADAAKKFGEIDVYVGDSGLVYFG